MVDSTNNFEPSLSGLSDPVTGLEPGLGGKRRPKLDRDLFWELLEIDRYTRTRAIEKVLDQGMSKYYASAMIQVLQPNARHYQKGRLLKVPYSYERKLAAINSLLSLKPESALHGLLVAMTNKDLPLQQAATYVIGQLEDPEADDVLLDILHDPRRKLRHAAFQSLAARWQQPTIQRLNHSIGTIAAAAARWLGENEQPRIFPLLTVAFHDRRGDFANEAALIGIMEAVGSLCARWPEEVATASVAFCREVLESRHPMAVKAGALQALEVLGTSHAMALHAAHAARFPSG